jgi:hypothetical protein
MLLQSENAAFVEPDAFENAVAIKQTVIEHGNFGFGFRHQLAVEIDEQLIHARVGETASGGRECKLHGVKECDL